MLSQWRWEEITPVLTVGGRDHATWLAPNHEAISVILTILRVLGNGFFMRLQRNFVRLTGMLKSLPGEFMPRQVILLSSVLRCGTMCVCGKVVKFSSFPM
jgi:hypothetical protein